MARSRLPVSLPSLWSAKWSEAKDKTPTKITDEERDRLTASFLLGYFLWVIAFSLYLKFLPVWLIPPFAAIVAIHATLCVSEHGRGSPPRLRLDLAHFNQTSALFLRLLFQTKRLPLVGYVLSAIEQIESEKKRALERLLVDQQTLESAIVRLEGHSAKAQGLLPPSSPNVSGAVLGEWELILFGTQKSIEDHRASLEEIKERQATLLAHHRNLIDSLNDLVLRIKLAQELDLLPLGVVDVGKTEECWRRIETELECLIGRANMQLQQALIPRPLDFLSATPSRPALPSSIRRVK